MTSLWTNSEAEAATGGAATASFEVTGLSIDTRSLQPGDMFVALKAARDGHDFVAQAFASGAAAALVDHVPDGVTGPCLIVSDVLEGLTDLAVAARARTTAKVIGVTGSVGKTSTKEMLRDMLSDCGTVHAAEASFNNHWGVPITLARMPRDADFAVVEIGMNHPGEIEPLACLARLDVAMITTVAAAHLEAFSSVAEIAKEKSDIYKGLEPSGIAVFPSDLAVSEILASVAGDAQLSFGLTGNVRLINLRETGSTLVVEADVDGETYLVRLKDAGKHFGMNALGCLAVARALNVDLAMAAQALGRWRPPSGRGRRETILLDPASDEQFTLIDDAFNANPASMAAALDVLSATVPGAGGRRIAVLGDMLELGPDEDTLHRVIADHPSMEVIDLVHCVGSRMAALHKTLQPRMRGKQVADSETLGAVVHTLVQPGDVVLVKGSKGSYVSRVVDALRNLGHTMPGDPNGE